MSFGDGKLVLKLALETLHTVEAHFAYAPRYTGGLFLIWGGLAVIGFLTSTSLARALLSADAHPPSGLTRSRSVALPRGASAGRAPAGGLPWGFEAGRTAGIHAASPSLDEAMDALSKAGRGEARILETWSRRKRVRLSACASCAQDGASCEFERGFLEGAIGAISRTEAEATEIACRKRGAIACIFEVTY